MLGLGVKPDASKDNDSYRAGSEREAKWRERHTLTLAVATAMSRETVWTIKLDRHAQGFSAEHETTRRDDRPRSVLREERKASQPAAYTVSAARRHVKRFYIDSSQIEKYVCDAARFELKDRFAGVHSFHHCLWIVLRIAMKKQERTEDRDR
jgi:hypothetical protein